MTDFTTSIFHNNKGPAFSVCAASVEDVLENTYVSGVWERSQKPCERDTRCGDSVVYYDLYHMHNNKTRAISMVNTLAPDQKNKQ